MLRQYRDEEIIHRVETTAKGFHGWDDGWYDIWIRDKRSTANYDKFCDKVYTYHVVDGVPKFITVCTGTSTAGSFGLLRFATYNSKGCAVLDGDTIVYGSHAFGYHKHIVNSQHEAYVEVKGFPYHRDNDKDKLAEDNLGPEYTDLIGANCHRAGWFSSIILNWSVACLVRNRLSEFLKWLGILKKAGKPPLNVCILNSF